MKLIIIDPTRRIVVDHTLSIRAAAVANDELLHETLAH